MILLVFHYTKNKGTADFLLEHLRINQIPCMYLRHPFQSESIKFSELIHSDGKKEQVLLRMRKVHNPTLVLIQDFIINLFISVRLRKKADKIISFGGFNVFPFILLNCFFKRKLYFWGCDYSKKRFPNRIMNKLYSYFETIACKYSNLVIQPTKRQEDVRIKHHCLDRRRSLIIPNGINSIEYFEKDRSFSEISLLYIGSITKQHGVIDFIKYFYEYNKIDFKLYIFGSGEAENELKKIIDKDFLSERIIYFGPKSQDEIKNFIYNFEGNLFGIAPYNMEENDHVYYGDSIKIKEYLSFNIPFISSNIACIPSNIKKFGFIYNSFDDLNDFFNKYISQFQLNNEEKNQILREYLWENIFNKFRSYLNLKS